MSKPPLFYEKRSSGIAIISTNDDPLNRMTLAYIETLNKLIDEIHNDNDIRAFVITAEGTANFSVGMNLKELLPGMEAEGGVDAFFDRRLQLISKIETMGKPSVGF
jgi:enoyl-CoA hydratase